MSVTARALVLLLCATAAGADVLTLKAGGTVEGIATERGDAIEMQVPEGTLVYRMEVVASLKRGPVKPAPAKPVEKKTGAQPAAKPATPLAPVSLGGGRPDDAEAKAHAWLAQQREKLRKERESRPGPKVTFEGGDPKCKSWEIYYGPGGKP